MTKTLTNEPVLNNVDELLDEIHRLREDQAFKQNLQEVIEFYQREVEQHKDNAQNWQKEAGRLREENARRFGDLHDAGIEITKLRKVMDAARKYKEAFENWDCKEERRVFFEALHDYDKQNSQDKLREELRKYEALRELDEDRKDL